MHYLKTEHMTTGAIKKNQFSPATQKQMEYKIEKIAENRT